LQKIETIAIADEIAESLIDTFPASDPPAWIPLARVGTPNGRGDLAPREKSNTSDRRTISTGSGTLSDVNNQAIQNTGTWLQIHSGNW
jgi:hypothetical protein